MTGLHRIGSSTDVLGEAPVWCPIEQALYWVDCRAPALRRHHPRTGETTTWPMPELIGSLALCKSGGVLVALRTSISRFDPSTGGFTALARFPDASPEMRLNDGKCDRQGRFWVGSMNDVARGPEGQLYRLDPSGACVAMLPGIRIPNSLCWSPDNRTMYFTGPELRSIHAYAFDAATGMPGACRVFADIAAPAAPDGATVDAEGFVWCAIYDGWQVRRYAPDGRIAGAIDLPVQRPTSCAFGGPELRTLYITTASQRLTQAELAGQPMAGALLAVTPGPQGLPESKFAA